MNVFSPVLFAASLNWVKPLWLVAAGAAAVTAILIGIYFLLMLVAPKVAAIARTTAREAWAQPLFWVELAIGAVFLLISPFIPYNTFGEDVKMIKDSGLTMILVLSIVLAVWTASVSVADEIEGRTALTLLSKPVGRRQFILGKFLGVIAPRFRCSSCWERYSWRRCRTRSSTKPASRRAPSPRPRSASARCCRWCPGWCWRLWRL